MADGQPPIIIVGAGPVGLYMAHAFALANIDFLVLEQQPTVLSFSGQLIFTWPQTVRLFDQIGLYEPIKESAIALHAKKRVYGEDGHVMTTSRFWDFMHEKYASPSFLLNFLGILLMLCCID
jgi:2-polyprenyl-6-methoxyphenol hydroxylase-like FAD-dependent oxidoreductase